MWAPPPTGSIFTLTVRVLSGLPRRLKGALEPVVTSLTKSLAHGTNILDKSTYLLVDLSKASAPHDTLAPTSPNHLTMEHPSRVMGHISMTTEVQELFS